ncbi:MAG TPA: SBBP repeat-containing protein [Bacteroidia bacterium]|nr:SBBP repeat-containing protein [Bacteroidia bacterium]
MKKTLFLLTLSPVCLYSQISSQWVARYNGAGDFNDKVNCVTRDASDTMYAGGYTTNAGREKDFLVMKIDPLGDTVWTRSFDGLNHGHDEAMAIGYDPNGFIYAAGYEEGSGTGNDVFTVKMDLNGDTIWTRTYNFTTNLDDQANALTIDGAGNVIVTGQSNSGSAAATNDDYITIKYSASGTQNYAVRFNGTGLATDRAVGIAAFPSGNVVVTGRSRNAFGDDDFVTKCYSPTGTVVWTAVFDGGQGNDRPADLVTDGNNNVYITGQSSNGFDYDYATVMYTMNGAEIWRNYYDNIVGNDYGEAIAVNANGNVAVTGRCDVTGNPDYDIYTIEYDNAGNQLWVASYNGPGAGDDDAADVMIDASNNVLVAGKTDMNTNVLVVDNDMLTISYNAVGSQQWAQTTGISVNSDGAAKITYDNAGNYIIYGNVTGTTTLKDIRRIKYSPAGSTMWVYDYNGTGDHSDVVNAMTVDANGNSYMCGYTYSASNKRNMSVSKISPAGSILWTNSFDGTLHSNDEATAIAVDGSGNVYITGFIKDTIQGYNYCTIKYNSSGIQTWLVRYNGAANKSDKAVALCVDNSGNVYVTGESDVSTTAVTNNNILTVKYNSTGAQQWISSYNGPGNTSDKPYAMALTSAGEPVVAGKSATTLTNDDAVLIKLSTAGVQLWTSFYSSTLGNDQALTVAIGPTGLIAAGLRITNASLNDDIGVHVVDNNGVLNWDATYSGTANGNDRVSSITFDNSGNVILSAISDYDTSALTSNYDMLTLKYNSSGSLAWAQHFDGINGDDEMAATVAVDNSTGYIYTLGQTNNGTLLVKNKDIIVLQYDPAGTLMNTGMYDGTYGTDSPMDMRIVNNQLFVAGTSNGFANAQKDMVMIDFSGFNVSTNDITVSTEYTVYPNPSTDHITISFEAPGQREITIVDMNGRIIQKMSVDDQNLTIDVSALSSGTYFGIVTSGSRTGSFTFVKNQ